MRESEWADPYAEWLSTSRAMTRCYQAELRRLARRSAVIAMLAFWLGAAAAAITFSLLSGA